jgi:hypothetical protein
LLTGRDISKECIQDCLEEIPESLEVMIPCVDFYCEIRNLETLELQGDLDWATLQRTFLQTCSWMPGLNGKPKLKREVSVGEKKEAMDHSIILQQTIRRRRFSVFASTLSSEENNRADDMHFFGKYSHIRKTLDYTYHCNYTFERQKLQDAIITDMLDAVILTDVDGKLGTVPTEPWIVFTAGAMGAGKSYTMNVLVEKGRFPLMAFVVVDPDQIRLRLREYLSST